ncbi:ribonuclease ZC3H12A-like [Solea senegalensis]|uniref:Ribonuclease ZC3H12A-like n=1 Tax=Solea senegalensis TaxID=28829 RepID=A0AAV6R407_SOLSE|nr:ribonuclease ZC3H12A [Solea senegalensis]XP_043908759.1 ribonuclease ZC3H12A [Solea senegalensis]KAG7499863.1 ribonuclease ZC3H12A-like [Solea senegalensis]
MNAGVAFPPSVHLWSKNPSKACLNPTDSDAAAWIFPSLLPVQNTRRPSCEKMYSCDPDPYLDSQHTEAQIDFFHKLGYSTAQVRSIRQKFGPNVDTDKILGQLVQIGPSQEAKQGPVTTMSVLLPKGDAQQLQGPAMQLPVTAASTQSREESSEEEDALRPIVIDGSNVAMSHGNKEVFSCLGIQLAVNYFLDRGHTDVTVFVPSWRKEQPRPDVPITDQHILRDLERRKILVFTPSRRVAGKRVVCNDDCFIVKHGYESDGIIVSNDMYRDLQGEKPKWKRFIEERLLMYSFVNNKFMPPDDPLGRHGPTLENFLRKFPKTPKKHLCPYGKKCTYGIKCKFHHPERAKQSNRLVADELRENAKHPPAAQKQPSTCSSPVPGQSLLLVEDMAKKLTLGHESSSVKKEHKNEQGKTSHRSSKKVTSKKEKSSQRSTPSEHDSVRQSESHEQLDSGLGSIDSQQMEAPWSQCDYQYGPKYRNCQHVCNVRQQCCPPRSAPCSCCSYGPPSLGIAPDFQHHPQHHKMGPLSSHSPDVIPHNLPHYHGYGAYPVSVPAAYSQPADFQHTRVHKHQQQTYWSDPFGGHHPVVHGLPGKHLPRELLQPGPSREEREVVRKKLLAIFSVHLVHMAMDMFPQVMDPQVLVAEILMLQSKNPSLR